MADSQIVVEKHASQVLADNPLGDPHVRDLMLYLPPDYSEDGPEYPAVYLLAGFMKSGACFMNWSAWEENIQARMDRLIRAGACQPMILVMPDCFTRYGGSQYLNSSATGRYEDYVLEAVEFVDAHFHTRSNSEARAVAGKSSGGYGALSLGMRHREVFGLVADHSGDKFFEKCYASDLMRMPDLASRENLPEILAAPQEVHPRDREFFELMNAAAMSACFSPNPEHTLGFDWPVDTHTGQLRERVWQRWKSKDPVELIGSSLEALRSLRLLFLDCGNRDEYYIHLGCRLMARRLTEAQVPHIYEEFAGTHRQTDHRYDRSLSLISEHIPPAGSL
jgi:enterochelin esterase family protein